MSCPHCAPESAPEPQPAGAVGTLQPKVVLLGNPNVGKSCLFNGLTGMRQETRNAPAATGMDAGEAAPRGVWSRDLGCSRVFTGLDDGGPGPWGWVAPRPGVSACVLLPGCERSGPPVRRFRSLLWAVLPVSLREGAIVAVFVRSEALG